MKTTKIDTIENYKTLACKIVYQALKDFAETTSEKERAKIIKDLKSPWMDFISEGKSVIAAEKLEADPTEICNRIKKQLEEEEEE